MPSPSMLLARAWLRLAGRPPNDAEELRRRVEGRAYPAPARIPARLSARCDVREDRVLGRPVYTLAPRSGASARHILYTHGGAYVHPLQRAHWHIVGRLMGATGATVTVPIYPLAPEHRYTEAYALLEEVYRGVLSRAAPGGVVLCGDSAGGGLALGQAMRYREIGLPPPGHVVLFSPWVDVTMRNPEAAALEPLDVMLRVARLVLAGRWWAGDDDPRTPLVSPLFGDLRGLPPLQLYQGTHDLLLPDARLLRDRVRAAGGTIRYHETPGGFHVFMGATFTPEAKRVFRRIAEHLA